MSITGGVLREWPVTGDARLGTSICLHNRRRSECKDCGGASICQHNRQRSQCKDCGGASICAYRRQQSKWARDQSKGCVRACIWPLAKK